MRNVLFDVGVEKILVGADNIHWQVAVTAKHYPAVHNLDLDVQNVARIKHSVDRTRCLIVRGSGGGRRGRGRVVVCIDEAKDSII